MEDQKSYRITTNLWYSCWCCGCFRSLETEWVPAAFMKPWTKWQTWLYAYLWGVLVIKDVKVPSHQLPVDSPSINERAGVNINSNTSKMAAEKKTVLGSNADKIIVTGMDCPLMSWINSMVGLQGRRLKGSWQRHHIVVLLWITWLETILKNPVSKSCAVIQEKWQNLHFVKLSTVFSKYYSPLAKLSFASMKGRTIRTWL